jgi:hypothetical protein
VTRRAAAVAAAPACLAAQIALALAAPLAGGAAAGLRALADLAGVGFHAAALLAVTALVSREWAKHAGFGWATLGLAASLMGLHGAGDALAGPLALGARLAGTLWVASAARLATGPLRPLGQAAAVTVAAHALLAPWLPPVTALPGGLLALAWLVLAARAVAARDRAVAARDRAAG